MMERGANEIDALVREALEGVAVRLRAEFEVLVDQAVDAVLAVPDPHPAPAIALAPGSDTEPKASASGVP